MPHKYQGVVFERGRGRGRGRGQGREGGEDPFYDTKLYKYKEKMENQEHPEKPREGGQVHILEELLSPNQQMLRQG